MAVKRLLVLLILAFMTLTSLQSQAQEASGPIQTADIREAAERPNDSSREALGVVFGSIVEDPLATGAEDERTMLSSTFTILNGLALICGAFLMCYIVFRKIFTLANDGGYFTKGNDRAFTVLRYVWGFAALVPTASGWSMAQLVVLWSASLIGVGTANLATDAALDNFYEGGTMAMEPARPETLAFAKSMFQANLCAAGVNRGVQEAQAAGAMLGSDSLIQTHTIENTGFVLANADRTYSCGGATYPRERADSQSYWGVTIDTQPYREAQMSALLQMQQYLAPEVEAYANAVFAKMENDSVQVPRASRIIATAARSYDQSLGSMSTHASNQANELREAVVTVVGERGWWELGGWYQSMAQANAVAGNNMRDRAQAVSPDLSKAGAIASYHERLLRFTENQQRQVVQVAGAGDEAAEGDTTNVNSTDTNKLIAEVFGTWGGQSITNGLISFAEGENGAVNPLIAMKSLGDNILGTTEAAFGSYVGVKVAVGAAGGWNDSIVGKVFGAVTAGVPDALMGGAKALVNAVSPFIVLALIMLFGFGITLSIYVPFIPFLIWFAACINWLIFVAIGVVAAPLWAFAHLSGEDNSSRTNHGYIFMLNAMLRPILMVIGFILAGAIVVAGGMLLNKMFIPALANVQVESITGVVSIIGFLGIYISASLTLIHTCFNLIFLLPDKTMEWIGGTSLATGQGTEQEQQNAMRSLGMYVRDASRNGGKPDPTPPTPGKGSITPLK